MSVMYVIKCDYVIKLIMDWCWRCKSGGHGLTQTSANKRVQLILILRFHHRPTE